VSEQASTEWNWDVEATEAGTHRLHLTLSALIDLPGGQNDSDYQDIRSDLGRSRDVASQDVTFSKP
jgi:hypothetical protein